MLVRLIFVVVMLLSVEAIFAQIGTVIDTRTPVHRLVASSENASVFLPSLAAEITKNHTSEEEKVTAIFNWITTHISYDHELRRSKQLQQAIYTSEEHVVQKVLERKKALCGGYAFLFQRLCAVIGIEAKVIHGFTKTPGLAFQRKSKPTHTWNAVYLDGAWQLLDLTWAVSYGTPQQPARFWLFTPATDFYKTHIPL